MSATPIPGPAAPDGGYLGLALLGGYGFSPGSTRGANYLGGGIGLRAGYTFAAPFGFAVAVDAIYHFGYERTESTPGFDPVTQSNRALYLGVVMGVDGAVGPVVLRPYALTGIAITSYECLGCLAIFGPPPSSKTLATAGAGLELRFHTSVVFMGLDARIMGLFVDGRPEPAASIHGLLGARFR